MMLRHKLLWGLYSVIGVLVVAWIGTYIWVLTAVDIVDHPLANLSVYPIACTTRGCVTTKTLLEYHKIALAFSAASLVDAPSLEKSFTTIVRRNLAAHAFVQSPATPANAKRYREEILHITTEEQLRATLDMSLEDYDTQVIIPFLQQEALREERSAESPEELYSILSSERYVIVLPFHYKWDKTTGSVVRR